MAVKSPLAASSSVVATSRRAETASSLHAVFLALLDESNVAPVYALCAIVDEGIGDMHAELEVNADIEGALPLLRMGARRGVGGSFCEATILDEWGNPIHDILEDVSEEFGGICYETLTELLDTLVVSGLCTYDDD